MLKTLLRDLIFLTNILVRDGICIPLPRFTGKCTTPAGDVNLWKEMPLELNMRRIFGHVRMLFVIGAYTDEDLLRLVKKQDRRRSKKSGPTEESPHDSRNASFDDIEMLSIRSEI